MNKWTVKFPDDFNQWLLTIDAASAKVLVRALVVMQAETLGPWETSIEGVKISKVANEYPELFRMLVVSTNDVGFLYGLTVDVIVIAEFGSLHHLSTPTTIKHAQKVIAKLKDFHHD